MTKEIIKAYKQSSISYWALFFLFVYFVLILKVVNINQISNNWLFSTYSLLISFYLLSRFFLAYFHSVEEKKFKKKYYPTISFGIPSKNEGENIRETILKIAESNYPKHKFDIIAINDGSTDNTLREMVRAKQIAGSLGVKVKIIDWSKNKGKREGMAECIKASRKELIVFIDSDSFVLPNTAKELVKYFIDPKVAAVAGHAYVANPNQNILTRMQSARYFVSFRAFKAAESLFGTVTCCSGCCSAYRTKYAKEVVDDWLNQTFLGVKCTYGDDRSLTNFVLRKGYKTLFSSSAISYTIVPSNIKQFMKQQLRWKKSWTRESLIASTFMWKKNPIASISFYLGFILPLIAPIVVIRALAWYPYTTGKFPLFYISGLIIMSIIYGLYYRIYTNDTKWFYGAIFTIFYTLILMWQLPYAILTLKDARWGTR